MALLLVFPFSLMLLADQVARDIRMMPVWQLMIIPIITLVALVIGFQNSKRTLWDDSKSRHFVYHGSYITTFDLKRMMGYPCGFWFNKETGCMETYSVVVKQGNAIIEESDVRLGSDKEFHFEFPLIKDYKRWQTGMKMIDKGIWYAKAGNWNMKL